MAASVNLDNFDMAVLSAAEVQIKAFVDDNHLVLHSPHVKIHSPLGPDALMDIGNTLKLASAIIEHAMDMVIAVCQRESKYI